MKQIFLQLSKFLKEHDGRYKSALNFQEMYKSFPMLTFQAGEHFGKWVDFGGAYEHKMYDMVVWDSFENHGHMVYREYYDCITGALIETNAYLRS
jgi:hypothetical protein